MPWTRIDGPDETYLCGDVEYEIGSTYHNGIDAFVTITYFVTGADDNWAVEYRCAHWYVGHEDDETVSYDYAHATRFPRRSAAIAAAIDDAAEDEAWIFDMVDGVTA